MDHILSMEEYKRMTEELDKVKYQCRCWHRVIITKRMDKAICSWCGKYVFKDKQQEFRYRIREKIRGTI